MGRFCPSCLSIGHVAKHCPYVSPSQFQATVDVVGLESSRVEYDDFFECYISNLQENGIKIDFELSGRTGKRKLDDLQADFVDNKCYRCSNPFSRKRKNEPLPLSTILFNKAKISPSKEVHVHSPIMKHDFLGKRDSFSKDVQNQSEKCKGL